MKKKAKFISVMLYPYIYMIILALYMVISITLSDAIDLDSFGLIGLLAVGIVYNLYTIISVIVNIVRAKKGMISSRELCRKNMIAKLVHIPAYIFHFILGMIGSLASVWGIGVVMWAIIIDLITIVMSGTLGVGASVSLKKEKAVPSFVATLLSIGGYIYCLDVIVAIVMNTVSKKKSVEAAE